MNIIPSGRHFARPPVCGTIMFLAAGCNKKEDNTINFTSAINSLLQRTSGVPLVRPNQVSRAGRHLR